MLDSRSSNGPYGFDKLTNIDEQKIIISTILFHFTHVQSLKTVLKHFSCFCRFSGHAVVVVERLLGHDLLPLVPVRQLHQLR